MRPHRFLLYAHRGVPAERPENTMASFRRALELEVDALELDVHATRDGTIVVSHDPDARRMANVHARWCDIDLADARGFDLGWGYLSKERERPFVGCGHCIPTLEEVLVELPGVRLNIDIKQAFPPIADKVVSLVRRLGAEDRVTLASFRARTLLTVRRLGYGGYTALAQAEVAALLATPSAVWRRLPFTGSAAQLPRSAGPLRFDRREFIAKCHDLGLRVDFWTVDDPAEANRLVELGADGIMTDDAAAMMAGLRRPPASP